MNVRAFALSLRPISFHSRPLIPPFLQEYFPVPDKFEIRDHKKVREVLYLTN